MSMSPGQIARTAEDHGRLAARATLYAHLATGFAYPSGRTAAQQAAFLQGLRESLRAQGLDMPIEADNRAPEMDAVERVTLEEEYTFLFARGTPAPPYETSYLREQTFARVTELADITGFYRAFGLESSTSAGEPPDHIGAELEFLAVLCAKEAYALENDWPELAQICRDARQAFLRDHLGRWFPCFAERLRDHARLAWYPELAAVVEATLALERAELGIEIDVLQRVEDKLEALDDVIGPCGVGVST